MDTKKIKTGKISEEKLVDTFGSESVIKSYKEKGKFISSNKKRLLEKISQYCVVEDLGDRMYNITKVFKYPKPASLSKLNAGLYQYLSPIILNKLLNEHDENNKIILPLMDYARYIEMINQNYEPIKYNQEQASQHLDINNLIIREFFEKVDDNIKYYIQRCLEYLQSADVLKWYKVPMVKKKKTTIATDEYNNPTFECEYENIRATPEEVKYFNEVSEEVRVFLNIKSKAECFYGRKAYEFCKLVTEKLKKRNILYFYDSYEIYYTSLNRCKNLLEEFNSHDNEKLLLKEFNEQFIKYIIENAELRQNKKIENELYKYRLEDNYIANFKTLSELTIDGTSEKVNLKKSNAPDYMDKIDSDFNITITKKHKNQIIKKEI